MCVTHVLLLQLLDGYPKLGSSCCKRGLPLWCVETACLLVHCLLYCTTCSKITCSLLKRRNGRNNIAPTPWGCQVLSALD